MARVSGQPKSSAMPGSWRKACGARLTSSSIIPGPSACWGLSRFRQSGFTPLPGSRFVGVAPAVPVAQMTLTVSSALHALCMAGQVEIWAPGHGEGRDGGGAPGLLRKFSRSWFSRRGEHRGYFHPSIREWHQVASRCFKRRDWTVSAWPFEFIPDVDLGGVYAKTDDVWEIYFRWAEGGDNLVVSLTVEGSTTAAVAMGAPPETGNWFDFTDRIRLAIAALPGFGSGVTTSYLAGAARSGGLKSDFPGRFKVANMILVQASSTPANVGARNACQHW